MKQIHPAEAQRGLVKKPDFNLEPLVESYGRLPAWRIRRAVSRFALEHLRTDLKIIPLEQGERLQLAGLQGLDMTYVGVSDGKSMFRKRSGERIESQLMRASRGLRYDIFVGQYWTREAVRAAFPGSGANFDAVSRVQAFEVLVYDKRTGTAEHSWLSLGGNKEKVLGDLSMKAEIRTERMPKIRTEKLPDLPKANRRSMVPVSQPASQPPTKKSLSLALTTSLITEAARRYLSLAPSDGPQPVLSYSQKIAIGGKDVEYGREGGSVVLSFSRSGHAVREVVEFTGQALNHRELAEGYRVAFRGFPLENNSRGEVCDYVLVATVLSPSNELHGVFVMGARG